MSAEKPRRGLHLALAFVALAVALGSEGLAIGGVIDLPNSPESLLPYIGLHALASLAIGYFTWRFMPEQFRQPWYGVITFLAAIAFFIPILGLLGFVIGLLFVYSSRQIDNRRSFEVVEEPEFVTRRPRTTTVYRSGNAREDLANPNLPEDLRLRALLSVQDMPGRVSGTVLHDLLGDPSDDMRLLAYGMLRAKERGISQKIIDATERRLEAADNRAKYLASRELAELNWEFIYQNLVSGDMRRHILRQGFNYAIEAIQIQDDDAGLWFVAGRLAMASRQLTSARYCLEAALQRGFPAVRVLPYLAECAFYERKLDEVHEILGRMPEYESTPGFGPVIHYWT